MVRLWKWLTSRRRWPLSRFLKVPKYDPASQKAMLSSLKDHPGWLLLMADLENRKAIFEAMRLSVTRRIPLDTNSEHLVRQLIRLDEAITWMGWIQWCIRRADAMPTLDQFEPHPEKEDTL